MSQPPVLILTPTGDDAKVVARVLERSGIAVQTCGLMADMGHMLENAGVLLIAEESLQRDELEAFFAALDSQPSWSDVPVILMTSEKALSATLPEQIADLSKRANVTLVERPVRVATLMTMLQSALRARHRQLLLRDALEAASKARLEAESANAAKSQFLSTMSHELRTPLNAIAGYAELLSLGVSGPVTESQRKHIDGILRSEQHLLALINDVLYFAKIEAGALQVSCSDVDITPVLEHIESFVAPQLGDRRLTLEVRYTRPLLAHADTEKLRQILLNLLSNAIKFSPPGESISISCASTDDALQIAVADRGEGIAPDQLESIFRPFVQLGRTHNRPMDGTGLGLAISRDLARKMGGDLVVSSEVGRGSTFTVILNRAK